MSLQKTKLFIFIPLLTSTEGQLEMCLWLWNYNSSVFPLSSVKRIVIPEKHSNQHRAPTFQGEAGS